MLVCLTLMVLACKPLPKNENAITPVIGTSTYLPPAFADSARSDKIVAQSKIVDAIYQEYALTNHLPSIVYGIIVDGKLIHSGSYGEARLTPSQQANSKTLYRIASMTKSFTAMAILKLRDEGKIQLHDPAAKYLPVLNKIQYLTSDSPLITILDLLTMSAGFPEDNP